MSLLLVILWPVLVFGFGYFMKAYFEKFWPKLNPSRFASLFLAAWVIGLIGVKWDGPLAEKLGAVVGWIAFTVFSSKKVAQNG